MATADTVSLDIACALSSASGRGGLDETEIDSLAARGERAVAWLGQLRAQGRVGFLDLPSERRGLEAIRSYVDSLPADIDTMVVCGIGGSCLGARAVYQALAHPFDTVAGYRLRRGRRVFFADNADPRTFSGLLEVLDAQRTLFSVVSKSGSTAETASQLLVVHRYLSERLGEKAWRSHLVVTTDPSRGPLRALASAEGLASFEVPPNVGGRFSVLCPVGLLPAAFAGLDAAALLSGADQMVAGCARPQISENPALAFAAATYLLDRLRGRHIHVVMPYADALAATAEWFAQLWAESLGKRLDVDGQVVCGGPTPVRALGATDQHSQLQLYMEGPSDKLIVFVEVEGGPSCPIPSPPPSLEDLSYLAGHHMGELLAAELRGTRAALAKAGQPSITLRLPALDARRLGGLLLLLEAATALAGHLYRVDPFDQPGVEAAKRYAHGLLGRRGFESYRDEVEKWEKARRDPR